MSRRMPWNAGVYKRVTLVVDGADVVTMRAASAYAHVFEVTSDYVNISGFNVIGATGVAKAGIYLNGRQHCNISDNIADSNRVGIDLSSSSNNTLMGNTADSNDYGISTSLDALTILKAVAGVMDL